MSESRKRIAQIRLDLQAFGRRVRELRGFDMTQAALAKKIGITQGYLSNTFGLRRTVFGILAMTALFMVVFGFFKGSAWILVLFGLIGFGIQGGYVGIYTMAATLYRTEIRSTGVGWATGMGRIGSIVGPILGGFLITLGLTMSSNFIAFSIPTIIAGVVVLFIKPNVL